MRIVAYIALAFLSFAGVLAGLIAQSGNLSKEGIERLLKRGPEQAASPVEPKDEAGPWARALREKEEALKKREAELDEQERRLATQMGDLEDLRKKVQEIDKEIQDALATTDAERAARVKDAAARLAEMKPDNAAKALEDWPVEDAAAILRQIKEKDCAKILDAMDPRQATVLLRSLQEKTY